MGFLKAIKNLFVSSTEVPATKKVETRVVAQNKYFKKVVKHLFEMEQSLELVTETDVGWSSFFSVDKVDPKLIGFYKRSKKKYRLLFKTEEQLVAYAAYTIEIVSKEEVKRIIYKGTPLEKMSIVDANDKNVILRDKERMAYINLETSKAYIYNFSWQPFSSAVGDNYWLVGTRQTYEGPGELYMFGTDGELKWAISFSEPPMETVFGPVHVTAYHLKVSLDYSDIFVSSMDRLYRFTPDGELKARIAISELKEDELRKKHEETQRALSTPPKDRDEAVRRLAYELAGSFTSSMKRLTFHSPFTGFSHDPSTDMIFILESEGRVTGWDSSGKLIWTNMFKEKGRFISWLDGKLVLSFETGETFWLDRDGYYEYGAKLPKEAWTISNIPNLSKYLIVCKDNRLYELEKVSGELLVGTAGHPGMELFTSSEHLIFFDGEHHKAGYLWLAPTDHQWTIFEKIEVNDNDKYQPLNSFAPEIKETVPFKRVWCLEREDKNETFGMRIVDFKNQRIFVSERPKFDARKVYDTVKDEKERQKIFDAQDLVCYDFQQNKLWSKRFYNYLFSVFLSPDSEHLFVGVPLKVNISYEPGYVVVLNKDGEDEGKIKAPAHGFHIDFQSNEEGVITFSTERGEASRIYRFHKGRTGKWKLGEQIDKGELQSDFGAGLNDIDINNFSLRRIDKKKYICRFGENEHELKLNAAIYEAYTINQENLLIRVGNKTLIRYNSNFNKLWEVKTESAAIKVVVGAETFIFVSKEDITSYNVDNGLVNWRISAPPKSALNNIVWAENMNRFIWLSGNDQEFYVASLNEQGGILNSQLFSDLSFYNQTRYDEKQNLFIIQKSTSIEAYKLN